MLSRCCTGERERERERACRVRGPARPPAVPAAGPRPCPPGPSTAAPPGTAMLSDKVRQLKPNYFLVKQVTPTGSGSLESLLLQRGPLRLQAGASLRSNPTGPLAESPLSQPGCSTGVHSRACLRVEPQHDTVMIIRVIAGTVSNKRV